MKKYLLYMLTIIFALFPSQHTQAKNTKQITIQDEFGEFNLNLDRKITLHKENIEIYNSKKEIETSYDLYSKKEIEVLERIVEAECTGQSIEAKMNVANVIINRVNSDEFPNTIKEVVFQKVNGYYQFTPILDKRYWKVTISDETIEAVKNIFTMEDTTDGALFFCNINSSNKKNVGWFKNLEYLFTDDSNHSFYR